MSVQVHPRFLRRRVTVREHRARSHLRRALWVLLVVAAGWGIAWLAQSPLFSVAAIEVTGAERAAVADILAGENVYEGRPLVLIRSGAVTDALAGDPWVREASVRRVFPDRIEIDIVERIEVAVVRATDGWRTVSDDGRIMERVGQPPGHLAVVDDSVALAAPGGEWVSDRTRGVVEFLAALPGAVRAMTEVTAEGEELVALVDRHRVRLGSATNMEAKAIALTAVLADPRVAPDATVDLIAPLRPAVSAPADANLQSLVEVEVNPLEASPPGG